MNVLKLLYLRMQVDLSALKVRLMTSVNCCLLKFSFKKSKFFLFSGRLHHRDCPLFRYVE
jgi:hypothetical protein